MASNSTFLFGLHLTQHREEVASFWHRKNGEVGGGRRLFQRVSHRDRRRAASHNPYRIPWRYRAKMLKELEKSPPKGKSKRMKYRSKICGDQFGHQHFANRANKNHWTELHLWHSKRMIMRQMFFHSVPYKCCSSSYRRIFRSGHRSLNSPRCVIHDSSYNGCIEILSSSMEALDTIMTNLVNPQSILSTKKKNKDSIIKISGNTKFTSGLSTVIVDIYERPYDVDHAYICQHRAATKVSVSFIPKRNGNVYIVRMYYRIEHQKALADTIEYTVSKVAAKYELSSKIDLETDRCRWIGDQYRQNRFHSRREISLTNNVEVSGYYAMDTSRLQDKTNSSIDPFAMPYRSPSIDLALDNDGLPCAADITVKRVYGITKYNMYGYGVFKCLYNSIVPTECSAKSYEILKKLANDPTAAYEIPRNTIIPFNILIPKKLGPFPRRTTSPGATTEVTSKKFTNRNSTQRYSDSYTNSRRSSDIRPDGSRRLSDAMISRKGPHIQPKEIEEAQALLEGDIQRAFDSSRLSFMLDSRTKSPHNRSKRRRDVLSSLDKIQKSIRKCNSVIQNETSDSIDEVCLPVNCLSKNKDDIDIDLSSDDCNEDSECYQGGNATDCNIVPLRLVVDCTHRSPLAPFSSSLPYGGISVSLTMPRGAGAPNLWRIINENGAVYAGRKEEKWLLATAGYGDTSQDTLGTRDEDLQKAIRRVNKYKKTPPSARTNYLFNGFTAPFIIEWCRMDKSLSNMYLTPSICVNYRPIIISTGNRHGGLLTMITDRILDKSQQWHNTYLAIELWAQEGGVPEVNGLLYETNYKFETSPEYKIVKSFNLSNKSTVSVPQQYLGNSLLSVDAIKTKYHPIGVVTEGIALLSCVSKGYGLALISLKYIIDSMKKFCLILNTNLSRQEKWTKIQSLRGYVHLRNPTKMETKKMIFRFR